MSRALRLRLFVLAALVLFGELVLALRGLPAFGATETRYAEWLNLHSPLLRRAANVVTAVTFDFRGFDTLWEETILFAAVLGSVLLLRRQVGETVEPAHENAPERHVVRVSDAVRATSTLLLVPLVVFGLDVVAHGHLTPGGGFQGGVILASAALSTFLAGDFATLIRVAPHRLVFNAEAAGMLGFTLIGSFGLFAGGAFMQNVLPLGELGTLASAGTIPWLNLTTAVAVSGGFVTLLVAFLEEALTLRERGQGR